MIHKSDIEAIGKHLDSANAYMLKIGNTEKLKRFKEVVIKRPGWTTPAELRLVLGIAQSLEIQAKQLFELTETMLEGGELVSAKQVG